MNLALEQLADNPIIDELVEWPPRASRCLSIRASCVMFRKPFIEVSLADGEIFQRHFPRPSFTEHWAQAVVILETLTDIELISEFSYSPVPERDALVTRILTCRDESIAEAVEMFDEGMYEQFLMQFGENCAGLPEEVQQRIDLARSKLVS